MITDSYTFGSLFFRDRIIGVEWIWRMELIERRMFSEYAAFCKAGSDHL